MSSLTYVKAFLDGFPQNLPLLFKSGEEFILKFLV